ncbi:MAG: hypothetical protein ACFFDH_04175 [Promethearchaeota archaeon]
MSQKIQKTADMKKYELETGKNAIWNNKIAKGFVKWQKGERLYDVDKERVPPFISIFNKNLLYISCQPIIDNNQLHNIN